MCEDGGPNAESSVCTIGEDCDDCGVRQYAECSSECFAHMIDDNVCDSECNIAACLHNDCSQAAIAAKCLPLTPVPLASAPFTPQGDPFGFGGVTMDLPVNVRVRLRALSVLYDSGTGQAYLKVKII